LIKLEQRINSDCLTYCQVSEAISGVWHGSKSLSVLISLCLNVSFLHISWRLWVPVKIFYVHLRLWSTLIMYVSSCRDCSF